MKKVKCLITSLLILVSVLISVKVSAAVTPESILQKRIDYYEEKGFSKTTDNSPLTVEILSPENTIEKFSFKIGAYTTNDKIASYRANVAYYKRNPAYPNDLSKAVLNHSIYNNGSAGTGRKAVRLGPSGELSDFVTSGYVQLTKKEGVSYQATVALKKEANDVFEMLMEPDESGGVRTELSLWNGTNQNRTMGLMYGHDIMLGPNSIDDKVPMKSIGSNKGIYIENATGLRLNYTFQRYRDNPTNFLGRNYNDKLFEGFTPAVYNGSGVEAWPNDKSGDPVAPRTVGGELIDTGLVAKRSPMEVKPGSRTYFTFTTGVGLTTTNPEVVPRDDEYDVMENEVAQVTGTWFDIEGKKNKPAKITGTWDGGELTPFNYTKTTDEAEGGDFNFSIPTAGVAPGRYRVNLKIVDSTGRVGNEVFFILIKPNMNINYRVGNDIVHNMVTNVGGKVDEEYVLSGIEPIIYDANKPNYILDLDLEKYNKVTKKLEGVWTEAEVQSGKKELKAFNYPTITMKNDTSTLTEDQLIADTPIPIVKGTWTNEMKSGGVIEIFKQGVVAPVGTVNYPATGTTGEWSFTVPKNQLVPGDNIFTAKLKAAGKYSDISAEATTTINVLKKITINVKDNNGVVINNRDEIVDFKNGKIGETISLAIPEYLEGKKYKFNPIASGIASGLTIAKEVTPTLNEINVIYNLNEMPVEIRYLNDETGNLILANLTSKDRKQTKNLGKKIVGTSINSLILAEDKIADGYQANPTIKTYKEGSPTTNITSVADGPTIIEIRFKPKFEIVPPQTMSFGEHKLSIFGDTKELEQEAKLKITNTFETGENIKDWEVTGTFTGFETGTELTGKTSLQGQLKYDNQSMQGAALVIKSVNNPNKAYDEIGLKNKLKLEVYGSGAILGDYQGTITWTLSDAL